MTFSISAVAACCSRASFNSPSEAAEGFNRAGRLALAPVRLLTERGLRVFTALLLPPVFEDRAILPPRMNEAIIPGRTSILKGPKEPEPG